MDVDMMFRVEKYKELDFNNYMKNPVITFEHDLSMVVGEVKDIDDKKGEVSVEIVKEFWVEYGEFIKKELQPSYIAETGEVIELSICL
ncbi:hypothetical protein LCGC14_0417690 [marine sediment metagenome]|uniref:Uncharacterized protein n=1 Tax=marine sediment metagenome TaxID=412755 RepID=A0A0F9W0T8_9ZZZZ